MNDEFDVLKTYEIEKKRADQLGVNCVWLIEKFDLLHGILDIDGNGSWQDRVNQVVVRVKILKRDGVI